MSDEPINELAVAASKRRLDALAAAHPELVDHDAPRWTDNLESLETAMSKPTTVPTQLRLPEDLLKRISKHAERLERENPGLKFTRADAVINLVTIALDSLEAAPRKSR